MPRKKSPSTSAAASPQPPQAPQAHARPPQSYSPRYLPGKHASSSAGYLDSMVASLFFDEGITLRVIPDRTGEVWYKACISTSQYPRHYLLTSFPAEVPFSVALQDLAEKIEKFLAGRLRPSPDKWRK